MMNSITEIEANRGAASKIIGLLTLVGTISVVVVLLYQFWHFSQGDERFSIKQVELVNELVYTNEQDVEQALTKLMDKTFFNANIAEISSAISALPWVQSVSVSREWPQKLRVYIIEREPVARFNDMEWLDVQAQRFVAPYHPKLAELPEFEAPDNRAKQIFSFYQQLKQILSNSPFLVKKLHLTDRESWNIELQSGIILKLGRLAKDNAGNIKHSPLEKVEIFLEHYPYVAQDKRTISYVDLRYQNGFSVGWQKQTELSAHE